MRIRIELECDNSAFEGTPAREVSRILKNLARSAENGGLAELDGKKLMDINGNSVGRVEIEE